MSTGDSIKARWFYRKFSPEWTVVTPTYPHQSPTQTLDYLAKQLAELLQTHSSGVLVGASMGGFYARYLANQFHLPAVLINPALDPLPLFSPYLGWHTHPYTQEYFEINQPYLKALQSYSLDSQAYPAKKDLLILLDKGDEVIPFTKVWSDYNHQAQVLCYEGGSHAFEHLEQAEKIIKAFFLDCRKSYA